jgi:hypothetical protein
MDSGDDGEEGMEGDESQKERKKKRGTSEEAVQPRPLHRTASIFLRNLAPTITKQEVEAVSSLCICTTEILPSDITIVQSIHKKNCVVSKVDKKCNSRPTRSQHTLAAVGTVKVSHVAPAVRFSCLLRGRGTSFQDGITTGEGFLSALF